MTVMPFSRLLSIHSLPVCICAGININEHGTSHLFEKWYVEVESNLQMTLSN